MVMARFVTVIMQTSNLNNAFKVNAGLQDDSVKSGQALGLLLMELHVYARLASHHRSHVSAWPIPLDSVRRSIEGQTR